MSEDFVTWDDAYSVNFELIDNQHKGLVEMTNLLFEGCEKGSTAADAAFISTMRKAIEYAQVHFYTEEKYMKQTNFPLFYEHKAEHDSFVATLKNTVKVFEAEHSNPFELARFLKKWLLTHIAQSDKKYAPYLAGVSP